MLTQRPIERLKYKPGTDSRLFHLSKAINVIVIASIRSGKTYTLINDIIDSAWNNDTDFGVLLCGPTFEQTAKTLAFPVATRAKELGMCDRYGLNKQTKTITLLNGKIIYYASAESPDTGIRGLNICKAYMDEMPVCDEAAFDVVMGRLLLTNGLFRGVGTPKGTTNWVYRKFFGPDKFELNDTEFMKFSIFNNPLITQESVDRYRASLDPLMARQEIDGEWVNLCDTKIYYSFDAQRNVRPCQPPRNSEGRIVETVHIGLDYNVGIMANPHAWIDYNTNMIYVFDEGYGDKTTRDVGDRLRNTYGSAVHICDDASGNSRQQSDGKTQRQLLNQLGLYNVTGNISNPPIQKRQGLVNAYLCNGLGNAHLVIDPRCKRLIHELDNLTRKPNSIDVDTQGGNVGHITDALGYLVYNISGGRAAWDMQKAA